jgi:hypothetical protein
MNRSPDFYNDPSWYEKYYQAQQGIGKIIAIFFHQIGKQTVRKRTENDWQFKKLRETGIQFWLDNQPTRLDALLRPWRPYSTIPTAKTIILHRKKIK